MSLLSSCMAQANSLFQSMKWNLSNHRLQDLPMLLFSHGQQSRALLGNPVNPFSPCVTPLRFVHGDFIIQAFRYASFHSDMMISDKISSGTTLSCCQEPHFCPMHSRHIFCFSNPVELRYGHCIIIFQLQYFLAFFFNNTSTKRLEQTKFAFKLFTILVCNAELQVFEI